MSVNPRQLFRTKALERVSSPDNLDQIIKIVSPKDWLPLAVLGGLVLLALAWSIAGEVPTTVSGRGVLLHPRRVQDIQTLVSGRLTALSIKTGDVVRAGDVIGRVDQFDLRRRIEEDRALLVELQQQDRSKSSAQGQQTLLLRQQTELTGVFSRSQTASVQRSLTDAQAIHPLLAKRLESLRTLKDRGLLAELAPELVEAEQDFVTNQARIGDLTARLREVDLSMKQAEALEAGLARENVESDASRRTQLQELSARLALNELQLEKNSEIPASRSGRILEVFSAEGQIVGVGARIATLDVDDPDGAIINVSYFAVGDGKKIHPGMKVLVTPDNVERQRFGGISGTVTSVSPLPVTVEGSTALVGNLDVVQGMMQGGPRIEVIAQLDPDPANAGRFRWSSSRGPDLEVMSGLTTSMRVTVEARAPITYLLPFLRDISGVY